MAAEFNTGVLTNKGIALLAKWQAGTCTPEITKAAAGNGSYSSGESLASLTALKSQKISVGISKKTVQNDSTLLVRFIISNESLTAGFKVTEIGIFAEDPDDGEILYSIATSADEDNADYLPAYNGIYPSTIIFNYQIEVANAESVTITAGTGAYAAADDFNDLEEDVEALQDKADDSSLAAQILAQRMITLAEGVDNLESEVEERLEELDDQDDDTTLAVSILAQRMMQIIDSESETGTVMLTNSRSFPLFNSTVISPTTVALSNIRENTDYIVNAQVLEYSGGLPGDIEVTARMVNGFKISFTGSASSVTIGYEVVGGTN